MKRVSLLNGHRPFVLSILLVLFLSCGGSEGPDGQPEEPEIELPTVSTTSVSEITYDMATVEGMVQDDGGGDIIEKGVVWSENPTPTTDDNKVLASSSDDSFAVVITELSGETTYFVRSFAVNEVGVAYGNEFEFTTEQTPECRLEKYEFENPSNGLTTTLLEYDDQNRLVGLVTTNDRNEIHEDERYEYSDELVSVFNSGSDLEYEFIYEQGELTRINKYFAQGPKVIVRFIYPDEHTMTSMTSDIGVGQTEENPVQDSVIFKFNDLGNVISAEKYTTLNQNGEMTKTIEMAFEYDNLLNPVKGHFLNFSVIGGLEVNVQFFNQNNISKVSVNGTEQSSYSSTPVGGSDRTGERTKVGSSNKTTYFYEFCQN
jgi:hypothetical protein